jgi:hypothetical protein
MGNGATFTPAELDGFNTALQAGSPATGMGAPAQIVGTSSTAVTTPPTVVASTPPTVTPPAVVAAPAVTPPAQTGTWFTVIPAEKQAHTLSVSVPAGTTFRFLSSNGKATTPVTTTATVTVSDWDDGLNGRPLDPDPGTAKRMDILETATTQAVTVIDSSVTPAVSIPKTVPARK